MYLFLMFFAYISLLFHEILGLGFFVLFSIHLVLNCKMFKGALKSSLKNSKKSRILVLLDVVLAVCFAMIIVTSVLISREIFSINVQNYDFLSYLHILFSYIGLGVISLHILLHFKFLKGVFIYIKNNIKQRKIVKSIYSLTICTFIF